jgi:glycosyltransferase involved in cell wall biosynthesis
MQTTRKTLIVSSWAPPLSGGSSTLLTRLFSYFPADTYAVLTDSADRFTGATSGAWLPVTYYFRGAAEGYRPTEAANLVQAMASRAKANLGRRVIRRATRVFDEAADVLLRMNPLRDQVLKVAQRENAEIILGTSGEPTFLVASYLAARASRRLLYVFLFDIFAQNGMSQPKRMLAQRMEADIVKYASKVFVLNPRASDYYHTKYAVRPIVVPNPAQIPAELPDTPAPRPDPLIVYTGAVYFAQQDALQNLVQALKLVPRSRLQIYTAASESQLRRYGLVSEQVTQHFAAEKDIPAVQAQADILFLPLAFKTIAPLVIETALPAKTPEYMASGIPILVHAPYTTYLVEYARKEQWGLVVDVNEPQPLADAIKTLSSDISLRRTLAKRAFEVARERHDQASISAAYWEHFRCD